MQISVDSEDCRGICGIHFFFLSLSRNRFHMSVHRQVDCKQWDMFWWRTTHCELIDMEREMRAGASSSANTFLWCWPNELQILAHSTEVCVWVDVHKMKLKMPADNLSYPDVAYPVSECSVFVNQTIPLTGRSELRGSSGTSRWILLCCSISFHLWSSNTHFYSKQIGCQRVSIKRVVRVD